MSLDRTLKSRSSLARHRNVLSRAERVAILMDDGRWTPEKQSVYGLPKVSHRKAVVGKKAKKKEEEKAE